MYEVSLVVAVVYDYSVVDGYNMSGQHTRREPQNGASIVTKKTKSASKSQKRTSKRQKSASATKTAPAQDRPARKAYAYSGRVDAMVAGIRSLGGSATLAELFEELHDGADGMFAQPRRIPATLRQHPAARERISNVGGVYALVKRQRKVAAKSSAKRNSKRTKRA